MHGSIGAFLLNTDMLQEADKEDFQCYKEKVIDIDLLLEPTPQESIAIASTNDQSIEHESLNPYIEKLGINNIRIIRRIYRQWDILKSYLSSPPFRQPTISCMSADDFYSYFKSLTTKASEAVQACMRYSGYHGDRKNIAINAREALLRIAGESELQAHRIAVKLGDKGILSGPSQEHPQEEDLEEVE